MNKDQKSEKFLIILVFSYFINNNTNAPIKGKQIKNNNIFFTRFKGLEPLFLV